MRLIDAHLVQEIADREIGGETASLIQYVLSHTPTIEAEPVRHGRWEHIGGDEWCCTNCGEVISTEGSWDKPTYKHCHECGAKMDGDSHDQA